MKRTLIILLLISVYQLKANTDTLYSNITVAQAYDTINVYIDNPFFAILDVRTPSEYATHIAGAVNIDYYNPNLSLILDSLNKDKIYLVYCASGGRSAQVFSMMQTKNFRTVYNMLGGMNAWNSSAYPNTSLVEPKLGLLNDSVLTLSAVTGGLDSVMVTITNYKNSVLDFYTLTDLSGTAYSTNFQDGSLHGARDYSFSVYYQPDDLLDDSVVFSIGSDGGAVNIYIKGMVLTSAGLNYYQNYNEPAIVIEGANITVSSKTDEAITKIVLYNIQGKILSEKNIRSSTFGFAYACFAPGVYVILVETENKNQYLRKLVF